ncbi:MAG: PD40 domain-containing protein [Blastocatellales bacterium]|nr:PD40 domain-containing protein [Blastocatellales bacterium]
MKRLTCALLTALAAASLAVAQSPTGQSPTLFQRPTVNRTHIAFAYAGDLWIVARAGGDARRLTTGVGIETNPAFSPDGSMIAFTGQYDGNTDVYVVPAAGGVPKRLTWHPGPDRAAGWTPDGRRVLFSSPRASYSNFQRLYTIGLDGGQPQEVPLPLAVEGAFSPDGSMIAYQPLDQWQPDWKRYRGGQTARVWIARLSDSVIEKLPRENSNDRNPMWVGDTVYFLSDRQGPVTIYSYDTKTKRLETVIPTTNLDIKSASATSDAIVYERFGTIHLYDLKSKKSQPVQIRLAGDMASVRPRFEKVGNAIANARLSPTGARAVFEARGEILTVPAEKGDPRNLTRTPGVMERDPAWSPDGRWIAYFSEESGEYALHLRDQTGMGEVKKISLGEPPSFFYSPTWSPDSKKIAFTDKRLNLWYVEIEKGAPVKIDKNPFGLRDSVLAPEWSPDSRWIAYIKQLDNVLRAVHVYSLEDAKWHQVTDGMSDARHAVFDKNGKYLYFTASTNLGPAFSFAEMSTFPHQSTRSVYAVVLRNDLPSPIAPESDEEKVSEVKPEAKPEEKKEEKKEAAPADKPADKPAEAAPAAARPAAKKEAEPVRIDFESISQRIIALPIPQRNIAGLVAGKAMNFYIAEFPPPAPGAPPGLVIQKYDLEKRKLDKVVEGVSAFEVSANGEKMLFRQGPNWTIASTAAPLRPGEGRLRTADMEVWVDPKAEWRQMYKEIWRSERDFFYDRNAHGLDLKAAEKLYEPYVDAIAHREDLNYLFREMLNQLTVGHMFIGGGDAPRPNFVPTGLLGADYTVENGRYRFARIYDGESWNPQLRAPLTQPGVNVKQGEYLIAVNGQEVTGNDSVYRFFEARANKQVVIKVGPNPDGSNAREVTVVPAPSETALRNLAWIEGNRRKVDEMSGGKLAYVYVPNTSGGGYDSFNRYFFSQTNRDGAVIDERFNSGGALADYIVEYLSRPLLNFIHFREGRDIPTPLGAIYGPKAMIINEMAGSGGDALPWYFRKMQIGKLIGTRTWGGLVASFQAPQMMDGGFATAPDAAIYGLNGEWEVENVGVAPDIEVDFNPAQWRQGRDPQLEKAVEVLMEELKRNPRPQYKRPPFPNYHNGRPAAAGSSSNGN